MNFRVAARCELNAISPQGYGKASSSGIFQLGPLWSGRSQCRPDVTISTLSVTCRPPAKAGIEDVLGDFRVDNLAGNREGRPYFGACVKRVRQKSSLRHEPRFRKHTNHRMCKEIVANVPTLPRCDCDRRPDAHKRVKARRNATARMVLSFANSCHTRSVQQAIGLPIDPRNTACQESGSIRTGNRKTQDVFSATDRGYSAAHDLCDASNIRGHLL
jgi:hypothetical protein